MQTWKLTIKPDSHKGFDVEELDKWMKRGRLLVGKDGNSADQDFTGE